MVSKGWTISSLALIDALPAASFSIKDLKFWQFIYKKIISKANAIIVNSIDFKKEMEKKFNIKVNCIFNPLDKKKIINKARIILLYSVVGPYWHVV